MRRKIVTIVRILFGIALTCIPLYYVYTITNLTQSTISISYLTKEELNEIALIEKGQTFYIDTYEVEYVDSKQSDQRMELILHTKSQADFIKFFNDKYSVYGVNNGIVVYQMSNYIQHGRIYMQRIDDIDIDELIIMKNVEEEVIVRLRI